MKVAAYIPLLYGAEYLAASIESYKDLVEKIFVLYTSKPSYGYNSHLECPETEQQLKDIVFSATNKADWISIEAANEGAHRSHIEKFSADYDLIVATDADEAWNTPALDQALKQAYDQPYRRYGIDGFLNFWKSFNLVCIDGFRPIRIYKPSGTGETEIKARVYHFGYAISEKLMRYKWDVHGHHPELRENWIEKVYLGNRLIDLHPVSKDLWNAQPFDKSQLPEILQAHPNYNKISCL